LQTDSGTVQRELATINALATTPQVLQAAARTVGGTSADALEKAVQSSADPDANVVSITASAGDAGRAATVANAVARAFLSEQQTTQVQRLDNARRSLLNEIRRLQAGSATDTNVQQQIQALQERAAELSVETASAGAQLQIAEAASPPDAPTSPRPVRNTVLAFFAALLIAVLVALARDQLSPQVNSQRELGQILDLPILGAIPHVPARFRRRRLTTAGEHEAYQALGASLRLALAPDTQHVILVTSATHAEGKTTVAAHLGSLLSQAGHHTLVVSGDLRRPRLDQIFGLHGGEGLSDLLAHARADGLDEHMLSRLLRAQPERDPHAGLLEVLGAGTVTADPARLLTSEPVDQVFDALRQHGARFVVVDAPPLLGVADAQVIASYCDDAIVVARLNRLSLATAADLRDLLARMKPRLLGAVVIGDRSEASPYYAGVRTRMVEPAID
jgi:capsular exopolysaccharide synthesis family protein